MSADGKKVLYAQKDTSGSSSASDKAPKAGDGAVKMDGVEVWVDPRAEWRQIYHEVWRIERDFLYDPHAHGLDLAAAEKLYAPFARRPRRARRPERAHGGDARQPRARARLRARRGGPRTRRRVSVGLLGADYTVEDGRYRFARILRGENWNPKLRAPLTEPGVDVKEGDFLLAVNGAGRCAPATTSTACFLGSAGKQTRAHASAEGRTGSASGTCSSCRSAAEGALRLRTWMEDNRKKVDELSNGRVGYVYIPDTAAGGFTNFNRYYFSQVGKEARRPRRALQPRRVHRRLHRRAPAADAAHGGCDARGPGRSPCPRRPSSARR